MIEIIKKIIKRNLFSKRSSFDKRIKIRSDIISNRNLNYFIKNFGNKNRNIIFYVIQRLRGGGMFSNLNFVLHHLKIAKDLNCIPIVDMQNFPTKYNEFRPIDKSFNAWDYYFKPLNKYKLSEVYKSKFVIIVDGKTNGLSEFDTFRNLNSEHYKIYKKMIKFKPYIIYEVNKFIKNNFEGQKILGVHFRGTDMKNQERHPFPATPNQIIGQINKNIRKYNYKKIFLVTEEKKYLDILLKKFKDKIIYTQSFRSNKSNIFEQNIRKNHRYKIGKENIIDMLLLAKTDRIICTNSHLPDASRFINKNLNSKVIEIKNGNNSNNLLIAQFLWYVKKILPEFMGGFKN
jgi:hypothetical protein